MDIRQILGALKASRRYIDDCYEAAFPDEAVNQAAMNDVDQAIADIEASLVPQEGPGVTLDVRKSEHRFFSYNPDNGTLLHPTAQEAREAARHDVAYYRRTAQDDGEWAHEVENVCWGQVLGVAEGKDSHDGTDFNLVDCAPVAFGGDDLSVAALAMTGRVKASRVMAAMSQCGLGSITLNQRFDVDALACLLDHVLGKAAPGDTDAVAEAFVAAFYKEKGFYPSLVQCYAAGVALRGTEDKMGVEAATRRGLALELEGVVADIEMGQPFDEVCLRTVKRVRDELYGDRNAIVAGVSELFWPADVIGWVEEQNYSRTGPITEEELSQIQFRKFGNFFTGSCTLTEWAFAFNAAMLARWKGWRKNELLSDGLSVDLLRQLESSMVKLGIATGEGGLGHFGANLPSHLQALCAGIERELVGAAEPLPEGVDLQAYRVGHGPASIHVERTPQRDGPDRWAVRRHGNVWGKTGEWEYEPSNSSRDDAFFERCRFATPAEGITAALAAVKADAEGGL